MTTTLEAWRGWVNLDALPDEFPELPLPKTVREREEIVALARRDFADGNLFDLKLALHELFETDGPVKHRLGRVVVGLALAVNKATPEDAESVMLAQEALAYLAWLDGQPEAAEGALFILMNTFGLTALARDGVHMLSKLLTNGVVPTFLEKQFTEQVEQLLDTDTDQTS